MTLEDNDYPPAPSSPCIDAGSDPAASAGKPGADANWDGVVNGDDYDLFAERFYTGC